MDLTTYLGIARRRWTLLLAALVLALLAVWVTLPSPGQTRPTGITYKATATLVASPTNEQTLSLASVALFATLGDVPQDAADRLNYQGQPQALAASIATAVHAETSTLTISSTGARKKHVAKKVNVFADELVSYFQDRRREQAQQALEGVNRRLGEYGQQLDKLDQQLAESPNDSRLQAKRAGVRANYQALVSQAAALQDDLTGASPLQVLQRAVPIPQTTGNFTPPTDAKKRLLVGAVLGLALGFALALVVDRLDSRLRNRRQAEDAFGLPVLAEIPRAPWPRRRVAGRPSMTDPGSVTAEAYRSLRSAVLMLHPDKRERDQNDGGAVLSDRSVILVTSPRSAEGKTSTVSHLAVAMAETGRQVLVLSMDFRKPRVHEYLETASGTGASDLLGAHRVQDLENVARRTRFPGLRLVTSGEEQVGHPGALLAGAGELIAQARQLADVVLIDTAPTLNVSDAVDLSAHVDAVLVVGSANRTTAPQAGATYRLLSRMGVPALGVVLMGARSAGGYEGYSGRARLGLHFPEPRSGQHHQPRHAGRGDRPPGTSSAEGTDGDQ